MVTIKKTICNIKKKVMTSERIKNRKRKQTEKLRDKRVEAAKRELANLWQGKIKKKWEEANYCKSSFMSVMRKEPVKTPKLETDKNGWPLSDPKRLRHSPILGPLGS